MATDEIGDLERAEVEVETAWDGWESLPGRLCLGGELRRWIEGNRAEKSDGTGILCETWLPTVKLHSRLGNGSYTWIPPGDTYVCRSIGVPGTNNGYAFAMFWNGIQRNGPTDNWKSCLRTPIPRNCTSKTYMNYIRIYSKVDAKIHVAVWISWYRWLVL